MASKTKLYRLNAVVTISIHATVEAKSKREAIKKAEELGMQSFCYQCSQCNDDEPSEEWRTSGELDGSPRNIEVEDIE